MSIPGGENINPPATQPVAVTNDSQTNIYISNLDVNITKEVLDQIFAPFGKVNDSKVLIDLQTGRSRGAALLRYESREEAEAAVSSMHGTVLPGSTIPLLVKFADTPDEKRRKKDRYISNSNRYGPRYAPPGGRGGGPVFPPGYASHPGFVPPGYPTVYPVYGSVGFINTAIYVANLPADADESLLYKLFGPYGGISSVKVMRDPGQNACKGFGFVNMTRAEDAQNAIMALHGYQVAPEKFLHVAYKAQRNANSNNNPAAANAGNAGPNAAGNGTNGQGASTGAPGGFGGAAPASVHGY